MERLCWEQLCTDDWNWMMMSAIKRDHPNDGAIHRTDHENVVARLVRRRVYSAPCVQCPSPKLCVAGLIRWRPWFNGSSPAPSCMWHALSSSHYGVPNHVRSDHGGATSKVKNELTVNTNHADQSTLPKTKRLLREKVWFEEKVQFKAALHAVLTHLDCTATQTMAHLADHSPLANI